MRSIAIHQPNYIPWLGYFYKIFKSDIFVFLDDVQYSNQGLHNYHFIKTQNGGKRLKIPVNQSFGDNIEVVKIRSELDWKKKHLNQLYENYRKTAHFQEVYDDFEKLIEFETEYLSDFNIHILEFICQKLGIDYKFIKSSDLEIRTVREEKIIDICKALDGELYYSGTGAKSYQKEKNFTNNGIRLEYLTYNVFEYPQEFGDFEANVTILDFLMNCGYNWEMVLAHQSRNFDEGVR